MLVQRNVAPRMALAGSQRHLALRLHGEQNFCALMHCDS
jgi:hypothetical protein